MPKRQGGDHRGHYNNGKQEGHAHFRKQIGRLRHRQRALQLPTCPTRSVTALILVSVDT
jgi:hypothetical protein